MDWEMDKLEEIFELQEALNKRIGVEMQNFSDEEKSPLSKIQAWIQSASDTNFQFWLNSAIISNG